MPYRGPHLQTWTGGLALQEGHSIEDRVKEARPQVHRPIQDNQDNQSGSRQTQATEDHVHPSHIPRFPDQTRDH